MQILAIDPWLAGSHEQLLSDWKTQSQHSIEVIGLPGRHWKWRQSCGAQTLAHRISEQGHARPDAIWVSDFVDIPQLMAFLPKDWGRVPTLLYFHENQLTYPTSGQDQHAGDMAPGWSNLLSAMAADRVVFNSAFHKRDLTRAAMDLLHTLPRPKPTEAVGVALRAAQVVHPGIDWQGIPLGSGGKPGAPLRVAFPHRFEFDKAPESWLRVAQAAIDSGVQLELLFLGESLTQIPKPLQERLQSLQPHIVHRGWLPKRLDYYEALGSCDLVVSSAHHEFYGMAMLEACATGCTPLAPNRLAYPEVLPASRDWPLYQNEAELLAQIQAAANQVASLRDPDHRTYTRESISSHDRKWTGKDLDEQMQSLVEAHSTSPV